jgi:hypothetical protein
MQPVFYNHSFRKGYNANHIFLLTLEQLAFIQCIDQITLFCQNLVLVASFGRVFLIMLKQKWSAIFIFPFMPSSTITIACFPL